MTRFSRGLFAATAVIALAFAADIRSAAAAQELNANEKLYAELFKLSPEERLKRMVEGANKEGSFDVTPNYRGKQMMDHVAIFKKRYPGINVKISDLNSYEALERVVAEETVGKHLTDASKMNLPDYVAIDGKNLPARYPTPATDRILPKYRVFLSPENLWVPQSTSEEGVSYHTGLVKAGEEPKSWTDLCHPRFKGIASYELSQTRWLAGIYSLYGKDEAKVGALLECIGKNEPIIMTGITARLALMMAGDHALTGSTSIAAGVEMKAKNPDKVPFATNYDIPLLAYCEGFVVSKKAPQPYTTALYLDWVLGPTSQKYLGTAWRGPVTQPHPYHPENVKLVPFGTIDTETLNRLHGQWAKNIGRGKR